MKAIRNFLLLIVLGWIVLLLISYAGSPRVFSSLVRPLLPAMSEVDSSYTFSKGKFVEKLQIIHGFVDVKDSCTYGFGNGVNFICPTIQYKIITSCKVKYYVDVDTSIIQINNDSKTFLIDADKAQLKLDVTNFKMVLPPFESYKSKCFDLSVSQIVDCQKRCEANLKSKIPELLELQAAKTSLNSLIQSQQIYLIKRGYKLLD